MASITPSYASSKDEERSGFSTLLGNVDPENYRDESVFDAKLHVHMRIHPDEAKAAGFKSVEIVDGSGDVYGLPVVFHNLHCLYALRRAMFPNVYIDDFDSRPPGPNQINVHVDHCFDM
ncbi:hypothetical protein IFR05_003714 [Cadophora sp. M221]|nr:hypothetical protein IFR05_003714 [Cadophora sp. M221]